MSAAERAALARDLHQLVELDRQFGVEFAVRPSAPAAATAPRVQDLAATAVAPRRPEPSAAVRPATRPAVARPVEVGAPAPTVGGVATTPVAEPWVPDPALFARPASEVLAEIAAVVAGCTRCPLRAGCQRTVPGEGAAAPAILFIGEGPGADEDASGRPFVGPAGQLLTRMIEAMGLARDQVYIANVVKCRPPGNRTPEPAEVASCLPFLRAQVAALKPPVICTLGNTPLRALMADETLGITRMRGKRLSWQGIPLIPTFHPSYLLRNPEAKKPCWDDLRAVLAVIGRTPPARG